MELRFFVFAVLQSGITTAIATAVASAGMPNAVAHWLQSWWVAWATMIPVVLIAAPVLRVASDRIADTLRPRR